MTSFQVYRALAASPRPLPVVMQQALYTYALSHRVERDPLLVALSRRPDLDPGLEARLVSVPSARVFVAWLSRPSRTLEEKVEVVSSESRPTVLAAVAADPAMPVEVLSALGEHLSPKVAAALLGNPACPADFLVPALLALDSSSPSAPLSKAASALLAARPDLHEQVAATCSARLARALAPSTSLSDAGLVRVFTLLRDEVFLPLEQGGSWELRESASALLDVLRERAAAGTLPVSVASVLSTGPLSSSAPPSEDPILSRVQRLVRRVLWGEGDLEVVLSAARSETDPAQQRRHLTRAGACARSDDPDEAALAVPLLAALLENDSLATSLFPKLISLLPYRERPLLHERLRRALPGDRTVLFGELERGRVPLDVVLDVLSARPALAGRVLELLVSKPGYQTTSLLEALVASDRFVPAWLDGLPSDVFLSMFDSPALSGAALARLEEHLGAAPDRWELFLGLDSFKGTLGERAWTAVNL